MVLRKGIAFAKTHEVKSWVMDDAQAKGAFSPGCSESAITNMSIDKYAPKLGPNGIQMVEVPDLKGAIAWLKAHP